MFVVVVEKLKSYFFTAANLSIVSLSGDEKVPSE
jgi:hypothetical protein